MRVIAGRAKGRRLKAPPGRSGRIRPSSDIVRGAIFSALASLDADLSRVLDLYAGSGALGIEALSRGAAWCDFVERDPAACNTIRENLRITGLSESAHVLCLPVEKAPARLHAPYTLVLADPPYNEERAGAALEALASSSLIEPGRTIIVLEHSAREEPRGALGPLSLVSVRRHGDSAVSIYR